MEEVESMEGSFLDLKRTFESGITRTLEWRKAQLRALLDLIRNHEQDIFNALHNDLGKHPTEAYRDEVGVVVKSLNLALSKVETWMQPKKASIPLLFFPSTAEVLAEPLGVVLIFSSWNLPFSLAVDPLIGAISAGNTAVLKPSEFAPSCSSFLYNTIPRYLDKKAIKVIEGGSDVGHALMQRKWDKIFFTGSSKVGRMILSGAATHLTPVTLELGGKCPVILDSLSKASELEVAVKRISCAKWGFCNGQACLAADYLLVEKKTAGKVVELLKKTVQNIFGEGLKNLKCISRIVNKTHFDRLMCILQDPAVASSVVYGGLADDDRLIIEPTILLDPPLDSEVMTEEIFGPLLPIITVDDIRESVEFINRLPKPLAIYAFTRDNGFQKQLTLFTSSGSITFNDAVIQFLCDELPFGGVGGSGFGRYHGKYSFKTFSHEKAVMQAAWIPELEARYPPWNPYKDRFVRLAFFFDYVGLLLHILGFRRRCC